MRKNCVKKQFNPKKKLIHEAGDANVSVFLKSYTCFSSVKL
ncbi:hypothetical protein CUZ97_1756 [Enterococcus faecium]|nr:hypothetical protein [Enterococcus faecium]